MRIALLRGMPPTDSEVSNGEVLSAQGRSRPSLESEAGIEDVLVGAEALDTNVLVDAN